VPDSDVPPGGPEVVGQALRVLVVDDNPDGARCLADLLRALSHQVEVAADGRSALEAARTFNPQVVLLDISLPDLDGREVGRRLRQQAGLARVLLVALTGHGSAQDHRLSKEAGFDLHWVKPVDLDALQSLLARFEPPVNR
jgi:CheY-like chemotaxis protein